VEDDGKLLEVNLAGINGWQARGISEFQ